MGGRGTCSRLSDQAGDDSGFGGEGGRGEILHLACVHSQPDSVTVPVSIGRLVLLFLFSFFLSICPFFYI